MELVREHGVRVLLVEPAFTNTTFDANVAVADQLNQRVKSSPFRPLVLPVAYKSTKVEDSATQKKYHCLLKTPSDSDQYFEAIDQALQWKAKTAAR